GTLIGGVGTLAHGGAGAWGGRALVQGASGRGRGALVQCTGGWVLAADVAGAWAGGAGGGLRKDEAGGANHGQSGQRSGEVFGCEHGSFLSAATSVGSNPVGNPD